MLAFSEPNWQLARYLETMEEAGLAEVFLPCCVDKATAGFGDSVPGRRWYSDQRGETPGVTKSCFFTARPDINPSRRPVRRMLARRTNPPARAIVSESMKGASARHTISMRSSTLVLGALSGFDLFFPCPVARARARRAHSRNRTDFAPASSSRRCLISLSKRRVVHVDPEIRGSRSRRRRTRHPFSSPCSHQT